jgi:diguanylate cyclase (GGDEF)-like protein/PAS domain S-box-containing protein
LNGAGRHSEWWFRSLVQRSSDYLLVFDADNVVTYASPSIAEFTGRRVDTVVGAGFPDVLHPDDRGVVTEMFSRLQATSGATDRCEARVRGHDGRFRCLEMVATNLLHDDEVGGIVVNARDVTERNEAAEARFRLAAIVEGSDDAIIGNDLDGTITSWNAGAELMYGYPAEEMVGRNVSVLVPADRRSELPALLARLVAGERVRHLETVRVCKDGTPLEVSLTISPIRDGTGTVVGASSIARDISERKAFEAQLEHQALHDPLTGLANRTLLQDRLERMLARTQRLGTRVAVLFLDLDDFKVVNDTYGHDAGDRLLMTIADRLEALLRTSDTIARYGGDEFVVACDDVTGLSSVEAIIKRLTTAFGDPFVLAGVEIPVTTSIGAKLSSDGNEAPDTLIRDADAAMYQAKQAGRARYQIAGQAGGVLGS